MCGYSFIGIPIAHGAFVALVAGLVVANGAMIALGIIAERRWLRPRDMAIAFTIGDPVLVAGMAVGVSLAEKSQPCGISGPAGQLTLVVLWLGFGLWQWRYEVRQGIYTWAQAVSPTKIWHQLVIYPCLGTWTFVAVINGLPQASHYPLSAFFVILCIALWMLICVHDIRYPKLGHVPFDWPRVRPVPRPWSLDSKTLRAAKR